MTQSEMQQTYLRAIAKFGKTAQVLTAVEELSELQKELLKNVNRGKDNRAQIVEEIADVEIMIMQLRRIYKICDRELRGAIAHKTKRLEEIL